MKTFGLTGNIGCGKSTVASILSKQEDVLIIDCDLIAKELISSGKFSSDINLILGCSVFSGGTTDLRMIAKIIFNQPEKKKSLEELIHPLVWNRVSELISSVRSDKLCIVESAIIYEKKWEENFSAIVLAVCNKQEQLRRLKQNRQMRDDDIYARMNCQIESSEKEKSSTFVIDTGCELHELGTKVFNLYLQLKQY